MQIEIRQSTETASTKPARRLSSAAYGSLAFHAKEDAAIWTRAWVGLGFTADLARPADILPVTVGNHGIHVERQVDGTFVGRFNKAQHGGCRAVPLQCQTGTKTKCSFTACGYSRDRRPILTDNADRLQHLDQYLGLRPERLLTVGTQVWGPMIAGRLDPLATTALSWQEPDTGFVPLAACGETLWLEREANWKHVMIALAASGHGLPATIRFPNVAVLAAGPVRCCIVVHPTALRRTLCRVRFFMTGDVADMEVLVGEALNELAFRFARAEAWQADETNFGESADADLVRTWFETHVAAAFEAHEEEIRSAMSYNANDKGAW